MPAVRALKPCNTSTRMFVVGLALDGTKVDYPLLQSQDNVKYLDRNAFGDYTVSGSIFLDYRFNPNFTDFNTIIYGHSMASGAMFGEIQKFADQDFFWKASLWLYLL